jgi:AcrR family transcriptional regulator
MPPTEVESHFFNTNKYRTLKRCDKKMDQEIEIIQAKAETQDEILLAALKLFATKGYFNTSLIDIADAVGMKNTSGIYHHFKNKQIWQRSCMPIFLIVSIFLSMK